MAAQLQAEALHLVGGAAHQLLADLGRAGEADLADRSGFPGTRRPISWAGPMTRLATPGGRPASIRHSKTWIRHSGVWLAGLQTMVQPAARAGAILRACSVIGKFHGLMAADHADRMLDRHVPLAGRRVGDDLAVGALAFLGEPLEGVGRVQHLAPWPRRAACPVPSSACGRWRRPARASGRRSSSGPWPGPRRSASSSRAWPGRPPPGRGRVSARPP